MSINQNRSLSGRLIAIVEQNAQALSEGAIKLLQSSHRTSAYHDLSHRDLYDRAFEVYHDLGRWLWEKSNSTVESWYNELGKKRCEEGIPLAQVVWALILTKDHLISYLDASGFADSAVELYQQQEFDRIIGHFFDRAICYAAEGYERETASHRHSEPMATSKAAALRF
jgi:hypothetical protein